MPGVSGEAKELLETLRGSHDRLAVFVAAADDADLVRASAAADWTVAEVLSHLGSQAEIFSQILEATLRGVDPPGRESFPPIWDAWNARSPRAQAEESVSANAGFIERFAALDTAQIDGFRVALFGRDLDAAGFLRMRVSEHALHAWDVLVAFDESATVEPAAVRALLPGLGDLIARVGKPTEARTVVAVRASDPDSQHTLQLGETVRLTPGAPAAADGSLQLAAEQLLRLAYGRLDLDSGGVQLSGVAPEQLRSTFRGF